MSEFTFAILIRETNKAKASSALRKLHVHSCLFPANGEWLAVATENAAESGAEQARYLSAELKTHSFYFIHAEDHGWHYDLFEHGERKGTLEINYETYDHSNPDHANFSLLKKLAVNEVALARLKNGLHARNAQIDDLLISVEHFRQALGFETISWVSFDYMSTLSKDQLDEVGAVFIEPTNRKRFSADSIILEVLEEPLRQMGYFHEERPEMSDEIYFVKRENGFDYGLIIDKNGRKRIEPRLFTPRHKRLSMFYIGTGQIKWFDYADERELRRHLEEILRFFQKIGDPWIRKNRIEIFDANAIYIELADRFMTEHSFERIHMDDHLLFGGEVVYQRDRMQIVFTHFPQEAWIVPYLVEDTEKKLLTRFVYENKETLPIDIRTIDFSFRNRDECVKAMQQVFDVLRLYFNHQRVDGPMDFHV